MAVANQRRLVSTPVSTPSKYGLLPTLGDQLRSDADPHWMNGTYIRTLCGTANTTYDPCAVTGGVFPPAKTSSINIQHYGANPFTVYTELQCSAPAAWDDLDQDSQRYIQRSEQFTVERAFYTGVAAGVSGVVLPHLVSATQVTDVDGFTIMQLAATSVGPTGGLRARDALGILEEQLAACYAGGVGYIHVSPRVLYSLAEAMVIEHDGARLRTVKGNFLVVGDGYLDQSPAGVTNSNISWMYATGAMYAYRGDIRFFPKDSTINRANNTVQAIAERTYLIGYECCLLAAAIDLTLA